MLIQVILLYFMMTVAGAVFCLYAMTDPNEVPKAHRQRYFPVGLGLLLLAFESIFCGWGFASVGEVLDSYLGIHTISGLAGFAGLFHGAIGGAVTGLGLGLWRNMRMRTNRDLASVPGHWILFVARSYDKCFGPH